MPVPLEFLRGMLGLLCLFFAYMLGRAAARVYNGTRPASTVYSWVVRTLVTYLAILWRHGMDLVAIVVLVLAVLAMAAGAWSEIKPRKPEEDLTKEIFGN